MTPIEAFIRQAAIKRGLDPDIAVRVALAEGGVKDPVQQSKIVNKQGVREPSYGPFQLNMNPGALGDKALQAGIDPRSPNNWKQGVEFALDHVAKNGWGDFHGAAAVGISPTAGVKGATPQGVTLTTVPAPNVMASPYNYNYDVAHQPPPTAPIASSDPNVPATAPPTDTTATTAAATPAATTPKSPMDMIASLGKSIGGSAFGGAVTDTGANQVISPNLDTGSSSIAPQAMQLMAQLMADRRKRAQGVTLSSNPLQALQGLV